MELTRLVQQYVRTREAFVSHVAEVTQQLNAWTDRHCEVPPTLGEIAQFEGLRVERSRLLAEFGEAEDQFVVKMLEALSSRKQSS